MVILGVVLFLALSGTIVGTVVRKPKEMDVTTISTLEKIVNISELSTYTAVYNGIASAVDEEDPDEVRYYVSYQAKINAGIDFSKVNFLVDDEQKTLTAILPEVYYTDIIVDVGSLDYIFMDPSANSSKISAEAFSLCEADVERESKENTAIIELAKDNAMNVVTALIRPILQEKYADYTLKVE